MSEPLKTFTIERKSWARGAGDASLFDPGTGLKCCLGFYALSCGLTLEQIALEGDPHDVRDILPSEAHWLIRPELKNSRDALRLMAINDTPIAKEADREAKIVEIFAEHGVKPVFVDELPQEPK